MMGMTLGELARTVKATNGITVEMDGMPVTLSLTPQMLVYYGMREVKEVSAISADAMLVKISSENHAGYLTLGCGV